MAAVNEWGDSLVAATAVNEWGDPLASPSAGESPAAADPAQLGQDLEAAGALPKQSTPSDPFRDYPELRPGRTNAPLVSPETARAAIDLLAPSGAAFTQDPKAVGRLVTAIRNQWTGGQPAELPTDTAGQVVKQRVADFVSSQTTPLNLAMLGGIGVLGKAAQGVGTAATVAKGAQKSIEAYFAAEAAKQAGGALGEASVAAQNPSATAKDVAGPITDAALGAAMAGLMVAHGLERGASGEAPAKTSAVNRWGDQEAPSVPAATVGAEPNMDAEMRAAFDPEALGDTPIPEPAAPEPSAIPEPAVAPESTAVTETPSETPTEAEPAAPAPQLSSEPVSAPVDSAAPRALDLTKSVAAAPVIEEPKFSGNLFQGRGATPAEVYGPEAVALGRAVPILGSGQYYAFNAEDAAHYGAVKQHAVALQHPFIIDSAKTWNDLLNAADAQHLNSRARLFYEEPQLVPAAASRLRNYLVSQGYDGAIIRVGQVKALRESFGHDTVVSYKSETEPSGVQAVETVPTPTSTPAPTSENNEFLAKLPRGDGAVSGVYRLIDAGDLRTSQDRGYSAELQPRDRTRAASEQQISDIVTRLDPERLGDSITTDLGAPVVDRARQVLSGNGRTLALRDAYAAGAPGARYKAWLTQQAPRFGLDPEAVARLQRPILVREVHDLGGMTPTEFARQSNAPATLGYSDAEKAGVDAARLTSLPGLLDSFRPSPEGDVLAATNRDFLNQFIDATGDRAELVNSRGDGYNEAKLGARVRNAVLGSLVGPERRPLLEALIESPEGVKRIANAVLVKAPALLRFKGTAYDLGPDLARALEDYVSLTRRGEQPKAYLAQTDMFGDSGRTATSDALVRGFADLKSTAKVADLLAAYADLAAKQDTTTGDMFGGAPRTPSELLAFAREAVKRGGPVQEALFARRTALEAAVDRESLAERQARWRAAADRLAPGLMRTFELRFGAPADIVRSGRIEARNLTGFEEAAYLAKERMLYLFDEALQHRSELGTRLNLLHEMAHAHFDTLPASRQLELLDLWRKDLAEKTSPLWTRGALKRGVARGVTDSLKEWYAERIAWANQEWAARRVEPATGFFEWLAGGFRDLLDRFREYIGKLRGTAIDGNFRAFLDQGARFAPEPTPDLPLAAPELAEFARRNLHDLARDGRDWLKRNFTAAGGMPADVFAAKLAKDGRLASIAKQSQFALRDFDRAVHEVYGGYRAMTPRELAKVNDVLGGRAAPNVLDPRLQGPIGTMRGHIDTLSRRLVQSGAISSELAQRVDGNLGYYLHRSYRKFDDPKWAEKVPAAVRNQAETFIAAQLRAANGGVVPNPAEVRGYVNYLLGKDLEGPTDFFRAPREGAKDLRVLTARKEIPREIRELLGEYRDPRVNYLRSVAKTAQIIESQRFLDQVRQIGLAQGWLFPRPRADATGDFSVPLAAKGSEAMAPLSGLYTTRELAAAFSRQGGIPDGLIRSWVKINGLIRAAKTVFSPMTQVRNAVSHLGFMVANGHWRADAAADIVQALKAEFGAGDTPPARAYLARLTRLGIVGESAHAGELRDALADAGVQMTGIVELMESRLARAVKAPAKLAAHIYSITDDMAKVYAFENERRTWADAQTGMTPEQLDVFAAERVRNTFPTYGIVPQAVRTIRRYSVLGTFMSWPAEIVRNGFHTIRYALQDLSDPNPRIKAIGAKRLAGIIAMAAAPRVASSLSQYWQHLNADDDKDLRRFLPEWNKNATLWYQGQDGRGRFRLIDASYLDPYSYLHAPLEAALRGEAWQDKLFAGATEAFRPFIGEGLLTKGLIDLARNVDDQGHPVYNPQANWIEQQNQKLAHLWQVGEPGFVTQAGRVAKAATGEISPSGRVYTLRDELQAILTGARSQDIDVGQGLISSAKRFALQKTQAEQLYTRVRDTKGTVAPSDLANAKAAMEQARQNIYGALAADAAAAQRLGISRGEAFTALLGSGLQPTDAAMILEGRVPPFVDLPFSRNKALLQTVKNR